MIDPKSVLYHLVSSDPIRLQDISAEPGIYALYDHGGNARYIGIAAQCLKDRILKRHVGGDGNSHKFSSIYNAGRMFHTRCHISTCATDGPVSKELRRLFAREHCRAVTMPLVGISIAELRIIENAVIRMAPAEVKSWNNARTLNAYDPGEVLTEFITGLGWPQYKLDALERQALRWVGRITS